MLTTTGRRYVILTLLAWVRLVPLGSAHAQAGSQTNRYDRGRSNAAAPAAKPCVTRSQTEIPAFPFQMTPLTLTGALISASSQATPFTLAEAVIGTSPMAHPQTLAEVEAFIKAALYTGDYIAALEYASTPLVVGNTEIRLQLLKMRTLALVKLHQLSEALVTLKYLLILEPNDLIVVNSVAEYLLITGQINEYRTFASKHKVQIDGAYDGVLSKYFSALEAYQTEDEDQLRDTVVRLLKALPAKKEPLLADWSFDDLLYASSLQPGSRKKSMLMTYVRVLMGDLDRDQALKIIQGL